MNESNRMNRMNISITHDLVLSKIRTCRLDEATRQNIILHETFKHAHHTSIKHQYYLFIESSFRRDTNTQIQRPAPPRPTAEKVE